MVSGCAGGLKGLGDETIPDKAKLPSSPPPDWVLGKGHPRFPQARYLIGVGISDTNAVSARESARSNLAKNLKVKINDDFVAAKEFMGPKKGYTYKKGAKGLGYYLENK